MTCLNWMAGGRNGALFDLGDLGGWVADWMGSDGMGSGVLLSWLDGFLRQEDYCPVHLHGSLLCRDIM